MIDASVPRHRVPSVPEPAGTTPDALFQRFLPAIDHRTTGEVLAHPGFADMRRHYITITMARYEIGSFPGGWQSAIYRVASIGAIVCLYAAYAVEDRATWPTLTRFKEAMATFALSSSRQIDDFVARLAETGFIVLERVETDRRLRLLKPTERLLDWDRKVLGAYYEALHRLYPKPGYEIAINLDPQFHLAQRKVSTTYFSQVSRFIQSNADLLPFHGMYQGVGILMTVANLSACRPERLVCERDLTDLRDKFGISRSHIRNTLSAAKAAGLLTWSGPGLRSIALTPHGSAALDRFVADTLASHDLGYRLALAELGYPVARPDRPADGRPRPDPSAGDR